MGIALSSVLEPAFASPPGSNYGLASANPPVPATDLASEVRPAHTAGYAGYSFAPGLDPRT